MTEETTVEVSEAYPPHYLGKDPDQAQTYILIRRRCPTCKGRGSLFAPKPGGIDTIAALKNPKEAGTVATIHGAKEGYSTTTQVPCPSCTEMDFKNNAQMPTNPWGQGWFDEWLTIEQFKEVFDL